jgi:hypothetical protein
MRPAAQPSAIFGQAAILRNRADRSAGERASNAEGITEVEVKAVDREPPPTPPWRIAGKVPKTNLDVIAPRSADDPEGTNHHLRPGVP